MQYELYYKRNEVNYSENWCLLYNCWYMTILTIQVTPLSLQFSLNCLDFLYLYVEDISPFCGARFGCTFGDAFSGWHDLFSMSHRLLFAMVERGGIHGGYSGSVHTPVYHTKCSTRKGILLAFLAGQIQSFQALHENFQSGKGAFLAGQTLSF